MKSNNVIELSAYSEKKINKLKNIVLNEISYSKETGNVNFSNIIYELLNSYALSKSEMRELENRLFKSIDSVETPVVNEVIDILSYAP